MFRRQRTLGIRRATEPRWITRNRTCLGAPRPVGVHAGGAPCARGGPGLRPSSGATAFRRGFSLRERLPVKPEELRQIGPYLVRQFIAEGGMAWVFEVVD